MLKRNTLLIASVLALFLSSTGTAMAADKTSKYRVYQDNHILMETPDYKSAENYAKQYTSTHVEEISTRKWLWNNYPRYKVYQSGLSSSAWEFATLDQAIREASKWGHASVRDLQSDGWVWNNYPKYRLYQGDATLDSWEFSTLNEAMAEAKKWGNTHIIELSSHQWVWDNIPDTRKAELRSSQDRIYHVYQGTSTSDAWSFAYLEDAVNESLKWSNSTIVNSQMNNQIVFSNVKNYQVYQYDANLNSFLNLDDAIAYAKQFDHTQIVNIDPALSASKRVIWTNYPYYQVYQSDQWIADYSSISNALSYAMGYSNASIRLLDNSSVIWDNYRNLQFWGWNGSSSNDTIRSQVNNTTGLDVVSPTYFSLADSSGTVTDTSNKDTVAWLQAQGHKVMPLVNNQFDSALTSQFLSSTAAQNKFIQTLVNKGAALGVEGLNIDFESLSGKDRAAFTSFIKNLTTAAHDKGLLISIDLPRGSVKWNAQTAFDHEKLGETVDYIITMTYDQYWKGSTEPGPVAGLDWVEEGIKEFLAYGIPRDKLIMGIPFYVREWQVDSSGNLLDNRALLMKDLPALIASKKATVTFDNKFGQYKVEYKDNENKRVFWLENEETVKARLEIAKKYDIAGVAAWRLGYDAADLWKMMLQQK
ncbi:glycosyl hydrolase family 18 protein [Paenibacillus radicis (ex Xue et al. 2023)]|uniref:Glycosyl hydrolase family 18 protein n=1 Tax=Paenibacillus radicis (ex Xue et al. 2023) TaxID=2972489 RepID=A0ABT1YFI2_9BACL|nr:glycosyl hydrolase family 18 protein [Paenibacillus radicis (ex Xue et al. 2023)]MCR8631951.1 glycosyl hydrolase family 18 protein [Paenibacillus radicis (ex Xue et al. 2023)]